MLFSIRLKHAVIAQERAVKKKSFMVIQQVLFFFFSPFSLLSSTRRTSWELGTNDQKTKKKKSSTIKYPTWNEAHTLIPSILPDVGVYVSASTGLANNGRALCIGSRIPKRVWIYF